MTKFSNQLLNGYELIINGYIAKKELDVGRVVLIDLDREK